MHRYNSTQYCKIELSLDSPFSRPTSHLRCGLGFPIIKKLQITKHSKSYYTVFGLIILSHKNLYNFQFKGVRSFLIHKLGHFHYFAILVGRHQIVQFSIKMNFIRPYYTNSSRKNLLMLSTKTANQSLIKNIIRYADLHADTESYVSASRIKQYIHSDR